MHPCMRYFYLYYYVMEFLIYTAGQHSKSRSDLSVTTLLGPLSNFPDKKKKQKNTCFAKLFRLHSSSLSPWLCHDVNPLTVKMHDDTINPLPAINLQEEAATVTDANLFITDNNALQTALIKAYQKHSKCGGCMSCRLLTGTVCASMLG